MMRISVILFLVVGLGAWVGSAWPQNPFTSRPDTHVKAPEPLIKSPVFAKLAQWQLQLQQQLSDLIRKARADGRVKPLIALMGLAFAYGAIHAAGPGHGKFIAVSYVLSHNASIVGGLLFSCCIAFLHGLSGAVGVLGLRYVIQWGVSQTLEMVTTVTQIASFGLITILGLGILLKSGYALFWAPAENEKTPAAASPKGLLSWSLAAGLVPCPAVVMVMLFCLSMDVLALGLLLAASISLGMAATLSSVVTAVVVGKAGALRAVAHQRVKTVETAVGMLSGAAVAIIGCLFLLTTWEIAHF